MRQNESEDLPLGLISRGLHTIEGGRPLQQRWQHLGSRLEETSVLTVRSLWKCSGLLSPGIYCSPHQTPTAHWVPKNESFLPAFIKRG